MWFIDKKGAKMTNQAVHGVQDEITVDNIRLTQYSHGAGCGCKISPKVLESILH